MTRGFFFTGANAGRHRFAMLRGAGRGILPGNDVPGGLTNSLMMLLNLFLNMVITNGLYLKIRIFLKKNHYRIL